MVRSLESLIKELKKNNESKNLEVEISYDTKRDKNNLNVLSDLLDNIQEIKSRYEEIHIFVPYEKIPMQYFKPLYDFYKKAQMPCKVAVEHSLYGFLGSLETTKYWDIETIINANLSIEKVCNYIKKCNLSPCEALAFVHQYVSTITKYKLSDTLKKSWEDNDQYFVSAFSKEKEFVCAGFATLEKEIIDNLKMPGLRCDVISIDFCDTQKDTRGSHARNFIRIKDEKYGIEKSCYDDATWDNTTETPEISHLMMENDCHSTKCNGRYYYYQPEIINFLGDKSSKCYDCFDDSYMLYDKGKKVTQTELEKIYFSMIQKTNPKKSFEQLELQLGDVIKASFESQKIRKYLKCNIVQEEIATQQEELKQLFEQNKLEMIKEKNQQKVESNPENQQEISF